MSKVRIKICCISSLEEARMALSQGVDALGLVSAMPSGPGVISENKIGSIIGQIPSVINTFLLTSKRDIPSIISQYQSLKPKTIQIVDELESGTLAELKAEIPEANIVQVVHVLDETSVQYAVEKSRYADALLLDSGDPNLKVKKLGGTGQIHNWALSRKIVESVDKPVWLAGGIRATNVQEAIATVRPYGVDLCSGVRTDGNLDVQKLAEFVKAARA